MGRPGCSGCCEHEDKGCEFTPTIKFWHKNRDDDLVQGYTPEEYKGEFGDQAVDRRMLEVGDIVKWQEQPNALAVDNEWEIIDTNLPNENSYDLRNVQDRTIRKVNIGRWFLLMLRPVNPDRPDTRFELPDFKGISVEFKKPYKKIPPEIWLRKFQRCGELVEQDLDGPIAVDPILVEDINLLSTTSPRSDSLKSPREKRVDQRKKRQPSDND